VVPLDEQSTSVGVPSPRELPRFTLEELADIRELSRGFFSVTFTAVWHRQLVVVKKLILHEGVTVEREIRTWYGVSLSFARGSSCVDSGGAYIGACIIRMWFEFWPCAKHRPLC
jgi:hypothetical protein